MLNDICRGNVQGTFLLNVTFSGASVAANTTAQQTITVPGILVGDQISEIGKATFQAGLIIVVGSVTVANAVSITFGNLTASPIVPTAGDTYTLEVNRPSLPNPQPSVIQ